MKLRMNWTSGSTMPIDEHNNLYRRHQTLQDRWRAEVKMVNHRCGILLHHRQVLSMTRGGLIDLRTMDGILGEIDLGSVLAMTIGLLEMTGIEALILAIETGTIIEIGIEVTAITLSTLISLRTLGHAIRLRAATDHEIVEVLRESVAERKDPQDGITIVMIGDVPTPGRLIRAVGQDREVEADPGMGTDVNRKFRSIIHISTTFHFYLPICGAMHFHISSPPPWTSLYHTLFI